MAMKMSPSRAKLTIGGSEVGRVEWGAGEARKDVEVPCAGRAHDVDGQGGGWRVAVPAAGAALGVEIVAEWLLVEAGLRPPGDIAIGWPEPRAVRGEHLVDQANLASAVAAELELGVGDDDPPRGGEISSAGVDEAAHMLERSGNLHAQPLHDLGHRDVLV